MKRKQSVWTQCMLRKVLFHPPSDRLSGSLAGWPDSNPETTHLSVVERRADVEMKWLREVIPLPRTLSVWFEWERPHPLMFEYLIRSSWPCLGGNRCGLVAGAVSRVMGFEVFPCVLSLYAACVWDVGSSLSCCHAFALQPWTLAFFNSKSNWMLSFLNIFLFMVS